MTKSDAIQDAAVLILKRAHQFIAAPSDVCPFIAWIYTRVYFDLRCQYRREWKKIGQATQVPFGVEFFDHIPDPRSIPADRPISVALDAQALRVAVECLNDKQREVVTAFYLEKKTQQEIAAERGVSQPAVHRILYRGLANLRRLLLADGIDTFEQSDPPDLPRERVVQMPVYDEHNYLGEPGVLE